MSRRTDLEEMTTRAQTLGDLLDDHHGAQVSCADALAIARAATRKAVRLAEEANARAGRAEQELERVRRELAGVAEERETAIAAIEAMAAEDVEAGFPS